MKLLPVVVCTVSVGLGVVVIFPDMVLAFTVVYKNVTLVFGLIWRPDGGRRELGLEIIVSGTGVAERCLCGFVIWPDRSRPLLLVCNLVIFFVSDSDDHCWSAYRTIRPFRVFHHNHSFNLSSLFDNSGHSRKHKSSKSVELMLRLHFVPTQTINFMNELLSSSFVALTSVEIVFILLQ